MALVLLLGLLAMPCHRNAFDVLDKFFKTRPSGSWEERHTQEAQAEPSEVKCSKDGGNLLFFLRLRITVRGRRVESAVAVAAVRKDADPLPRLDTRASASRRRKNSSSSGSSGPKTPGGRVEVAHWSFEGPEGRRAAGLFIVVYHLN